MSIFSLLDYLRLDDVDQMSDADLLARLEPILISDWDLSVMDDVMPLLVRFNHLWSKFIERHHLSTTAISLGQLEPVVDLESRDFERRIIIASLKFSVFIIVTCSKTHAFPCLDVRAVFVYSLQLKFLVSAGQSTLEL